MKINSSEISEETIYVWTCPKCNYVNESREDPDYEEYYYCEECNEQIEIESD
jgi:predicted SprT family Zn-dependent metalloprotease